MTTLGNEYGILDAVRNAAEDQLPDVSFTVVRSSQQPWAWAIQVSFAGAYRRHIYWRSGQWHATMRYPTETDEVNILEPIASATDEVTAVHRGTVIALAEAGSVALDVVADAQALEGPTGPDAERSALIVFGASIKALEEIQRSGTIFDAETRALASTLRSEWLIGRLDDLQG